MDVIIKSITADPACVGYIILSLDGTIQESSSRLENRHDVANNIFQVFASLKDRPKARIMFHVDDGQINAYQMNGKYVIVQKKPPLEFME